MGASRRTAVEPLAAEIDGLVSGAKALEGAFWGVEVVRLSDGKILYEHDAGLRFVPASNTKLFSTALALRTLGPDYRFATTVRAEPNGDLALVGGGDPTLTNRVSGRAYPYSKDGPIGDGVGAVAQLADQLVAGGLTEVRGDIIGDDTRYPWAPIPDGWSSGDWLYDYGSPVSALVVDDNRFTVGIGPGEAEGDLARLTVNLGMEWLTIENRVTTGGAKREIHVEGQPGSAELRIWGNIPVGDAGVRESLAIADPARYGAEALRSALVERGVAVRGRAVARHRFLDAGKETAGVGRELARRVSPPLSEIIQVTDKVSQNLYAEVLLREVGRERRSSGTVEGGMAELREFLGEAGVAEEAYRLRDGSGMARNGLVSPRAVIGLLRFMWASGDREMWVGMLPVGGKDGTLRNRFGGRGEASGIHAKTGSLGNVRALGGYARSGRYGDLAFSMMVNHYLVADSEVTGLLDKIGLALVR